MRRPKIASAKPEEGWSLDARFAAASHGSGHIIGVQEIFVEGKEGGREEEKEGEFVKQSPQKNTSSSLTHSRLQRVGC